MIQMIEGSLPKDRSSRAATNRPRVEIIQRWVETADERCPLACIWSALPEITTVQDDETELTQPAFSFFRLKAGCLHSINIHPARFILAQSLRNSIHTVAALLLVTISLAANAQQQEADARPEHSAELPDAPSEDSSSPTMFPPSEHSRYYIAGQANIIFQSDGPFHSPYEGTNSFISRGEYKTSLLGTLFLGAQVRRDPKTETDALFNLESAGGRGLSEALGLAGFTNLDVVRNPNLGPVPYMARYQIHQTIGLSQQTTEQEAGEFALA